MHACRSTLEDPTKVCTADQCHSAFCAANGDCQTTPLTGPACDDGTSCTSGDVCSDGECGGTQVACAPPGQGQLPGTCDPATDSCVYPPAPTGTPCDDGNACTTGDAWNANPLSLPTVVSNESIEGSAAGLNDEGDIVGMNQATMTAVGWSGTTQVSYALRPGATSAVYAINNSGVAVGMTRASPGAYAQPEKWIDGVLASFGPLPTGAKGGDVRGINDRGQAVGTVWDANGVFRPAVWDGSTVAYLPMPAGTIHGDAVAINESSVVAGTIDERPVFWANGFSQPPTYLDAPGISGYAAAINSAGDVVGYFARSGRYAPALWTRGVRIDLDVGAFTGSVHAFGINDDGHVVGYASGGTRVPIVWGTDHKIGGVLPLPGGYLWGDARAINAHGQIVGTGPDATGRRRVLLWQWSPGGRCEGGVPVVCTGTTCTDAGTCNPATGQCSQIPKANGTTCSDGSACTVGDACTNGTCVAGGPAVCASPDSCHAGVCDPTTGCSVVALAEYAPCNDGDACTQADRCVAGVCLPLSTVTCAQAGQCQESVSCNPLTGACQPENKPDDTACTDNNVCTEIDVCVAGACQLGMPRFCGSPNACLVAGSCHPQTGCPALTPRNCDDGNQCTNDSCSTSSGFFGPAGCRHSPIPIDDGIECTVDSCSAEGGVQHTPVNCNACLTDNGGCSQICTNASPSHVCSCKPGYVLAADGKSCNPTFLVSAGNEVKRWNGTDFETFIAPGAGGLSGAMGLVVQPGTNDILVASSGTKQVKRYRQDGSFANNLLTLSLTPYDLALSSDGRLWVSYAGSAVVESYDAVNGGPMLTSISLPLIGGSTGTFQKLAIHGDYIYRTNGGPIISRKKLDGTSSNSWSLAGSAFSSVLSLPDRLLVGGATTNVKEFLNNGTFVWNDYLNAGSTVTARMTDLDLGVDGLIYTTDNKSGLVEWYNPLTRELEGSTSTLATPQQTLFHSPGAPICVLGAGGLTCSCAPGYQYAADGYTCIDIDECLTGTDGCDRVNGACTNSPGTFKCSCNPAYRLADDQRTCNRIPTFLTTTDKSVQFWNGTAWSTFVSAGAGGLDYAGGIVVQPGTGDVLVASSKSGGGIERYSRTGQWVSHFIPGRNGYSPTDLAIGPDGRLWVTYKGTFSFVALFNASTGSKLKETPLPAQASWLNPRIAFQGPSFFLTTATSVWRFALDGVLPAAPFVTNTVERPNAILVEPDGNLLVGAGPYVDRWSGTSGSTLGRYADVRQGGGNVWDSVSDLDRGSDELLYVTKASSIGLGTPVSWRHPTSGLEIGRTTPLYRTTQTTFFTPPSARSCNVANGGCAGTCSPNGSGVTCSCPPGWTVDPAGGCSTSGTVSDPAWGLADTYTSSGSVITLTPITAGVTFANPAAALTGNTSSFTCPYRTTKPPGIRSYSVTFTIPPGATVAAQCSKCVSPHVGLECMRTAVTCPAGTPNCTVIGSSSTNGSSYSTLTLKPGNNYTWGSLSSDAANPDTAPFAWVSELPDTTPENAVIASGDLRPADHIEDSVDEYGNLVLTNAGGTPMTFTLNNTETTLAPGASVSDQCPSVQGDAAHAGCSAAHKVTLTEHVIRQGGGSTQGGLAGARVRVFDRAQLAGKAIACDNATIVLPQNPSTDQYPCIFEDPQTQTARLGGCTTGADGTCLAGVTAIGDQLVIAQVVTAAGILTTGLPRDAGGFSDTNGDGIGDLGTVNFHTMKVIAKDGRVTYRLAQRSELRGSLLEILAPADAVWDEGTTRYLYPYIFTSDSPWDVNVCTALPEGYEVVGVYDDSGNLISTTDCVQSFVDTETKVILFDVEDVGSPKKFNVESTIKARHRGQPWQQTRVRVPTYNPNAGRHHGHR